MEINVVVTGIMGRMGQALAKAVLARSDAFRLVAATEVPGSCAVGRDAGEVVCAGKAGALVFPSLQDALSGADADLVIDFTRHDATSLHAAVCATAGVGMVVGTTGLDESEREAVRKASETVPVLMAPNMSVGVVAMQRLVREAARILGSGYDVEITEMHHRHKKDAPSGTALNLARMAAGTLGLDPEKSLVLARSGLVGERSEGEIGVQSVRGGDCVGEHTAFFFGQGERLEITHRAFSREQFAGGALRAAQWLAGKPAGLYDMEDVLGLK